ncbi:hypothetical protein L484_010666 [Morus notabilis]|uniref:Uncharacterized protein n=1 Tax=Morus notabilis TaxID=981085 RepID=W9RZN6_9ROSA|nr:hypothetical protein L484_010666 [Morus notabilis]
MAIGHPNKQNSKVHIATKNPKLKSFQGDAHYSHNQFHPLHHLPLQPKVRSDISHRDKSFTLIWWALGVIGQPSSAPESCRWQGLR